MKVQLLVPGNGDPWLVDRCISVVGTANMDQRSFHLNFEMNAMVYGSPMADELAAVFALELQDMERIDPEQWRCRLSG